MDAFYFKVRYFRLYISANPMSAFSCNALNTSLRTYLNFKCFTICFSFGRSKEIFDAIHIELFAEVYSAGGNCKFFLKNLKKQELTLSLSS